MVSPRMPTFTDRPSHQSHKARSAVGKRPSEGYDLRETGPLKVRGSFVAARPGHPRASDRAALFLTSQGAYRWLSPRSRSAVCATTQSLTKFHRFVGTLVYGPVPQ